MNIKRTAVLGPFVMEFDVDGERYVCDIVDYGFSYNAARVRKEVPFLKYFKRLAKVTTKMNGIASFKHQSVESVEKFFVDAILEHKQFEKRWQVK